MVTHILDDWWWHGDQEKEGKQLLRVKSKCLHATALFYLLFLVILGTSLICKLTSFYYFCIIIRT